MTIVARNLERLKLARDDVHAACRHGEAQKVECLSLDVGRDCGQVERAINELQDNLGTCHMLVSCAGTAVGGRIEDTSEEMARHLVDLNLMGNYYVTRAVVPRMKAARDGKIVIVGSQASLLGESCFVSVVVGCVCFWPLKIGRWPSILHGNDRRESCRRDRGTIIY